LRIRRFTSAAQKVLSLIPSDVDRPLGDIKPKIQVADLPLLIQDAISGMHHHEQSVRDLSGRSYVMKIRPSTTTEGKIEGAILTLTDVEALLHSQDIRQSLETSLRSLLDEPHDLLLAVSPEGQPLFLKPGLDQSIFDYLEPRDREPMQRCLRQAVETRSPATMEVRKFKLIESKGPVVLTVEPIVTKDGVLALGVKAAVKRQVASGALH
jgi:PAS domain